LSSSFLSSLFSLPIITHIPMRLLLFRCTIRTTIFGLRGGRFVYNIFAFGSVLCHICKIDKKIVERASIMKKSAPKIQQA
jgi:hypothetical protein